MEIHPSSALSVLSVPSYQHLQSCNQRAVSYAVLLDHLGCDPFDPEVLVFGERDVGSV